jgi:hypothetical protein
MPLREMLREESEIMSDTSPERIRGSDKHDPERSWR